MRQDWYTKDWEEIDTVSPNGKKRKTEIYTGQYYGFGFDDKGLFKLKIAYAVPTAAIFIFYVITVLSKSQATECFYTCIPYAFAAVAYMPYAISAITLCNSPRAMTYRNYYAAHIRLRFVAKIMAFFLGLSAIGDLIYIIRGFSGHISKFGSAASEITWFICVFCCAICGLFIVLLIHKYPAMRLVIHHADDGTDPERPKSKWEI